eukprot:CAMPEP_0185773866 /NCGR_PEP_ID=MMETSP1174-20130828/75389_1 /TAXON_ID=35687 /ORGANISM="Dictyocha speculum, Strain CCMP1381" /LENGTH=292 /DNA_ID=CAMNT_0028460735 /DNA_START=155 /DNA_END=1033 /DNA_ORIENTATION=+
MTLLSSALVFVLIASELAVFFNVETVHHMTVDSIGQGTKKEPPVVITLHATFHHLPCDDVHIEIEATRGETTDEFVDKVDKFPIEYKAEEGAPEVVAGCRLDGTLNVGKVGGNFHISARGNIHLGMTSLFQGLGGGLIRMNAPMGGGNPFQGVNLSHTIHELSFGDSFPGMSNPLTDVFNLVPTDVGQYQFHLKVIPTLYKFLRKAPIITNQYSLSEQFVKLDIFSVLRANSPAGVYFYYDFYPIMVEYHDEKPSFLEFITRVCGIIGGVFTVSSLIDGAFHQSYEQMKKAA